MADNRINLRSIILDALLPVSSGEAYSHVLIKNILDKYNYLDRRDKAFIKRMVEGTLEKRIYLDYVIDSFSKVRTARMKPLIRELVRMSTYQILFMDSVPDHAACAEAVRLAKKRGFAGLSGFVNGVLRSISRGRDSIRLPDEATDRLNFLSVRYSMPVWIVEKWIDELGDDRTVKVLESLEAVHPVSIRRRLSVTDEEWKGVTAELEGAGMGIFQSESLPCAFTLDRADSLADTQAFKTGRITVMDISSMLAVECLGIREGDRILDVCAAPGGKLFFASEKAGITGEVLGRDISEYKLALMEESRMRLGADNVRLEIHDALAPDESLAGSMDAVIADLPCSGLGVMGKKRDIRYNVSPGSIESLSGLQRGMLSVVQSYVRPGGRLLFSTCTVSREENEENRRWFLDNFDFVPAKLPDIPVLEQGIRYGEGCVQLLPDAAMDGFFISVFQKK